MERGHRGDKQIVHNGRNEAIAPTVLIRNGRKAVGIAEAYHNGLGIDLKGKAAAHQRRKPTKDHRCHGIAQHNRPNVARMRAGIAGCYHTEDNTEGNAVKVGANQVIVTQNEQR